MRTLEANGLYEASVVEHIFTSAFCDVINRRSSCVDSWIRYMDDDN